MGADLIVYLVKGPAELDTTLEKNAVEHARRVVARAKEVTARWDSDEPSEMDVGGLPIEDALIQHILDNGDAEYELPQVACYSDKEISEAVTAVYDLWASGSRDSSSRFDPDNRARRIVVAGDMSWGDEPDGTGYQTIKEAERLGILKVLGIR